MRIFLFAILFLLLIAPSAYTQSLLDTAFVTAAQVPMKINETGRNITVITAQEIANLPATSLDEILQTVTGLEVQSRGGFGVQGDISLRGATFTQVLLLIDGMKMNDPLTGHFNGYIPVTPAEIERIEILRGAASAMYGADAVGGVINIVTKTFANGEIGTELSGEFNYGEHKLVSAQQGFSVRKEKFTFGGGFAMNQSEGELFPEKMIDTSTVLEAYRSFFDVKTVGVSFGYDFTEDFSLRFRSSYDYRDIGARYFYTTSPFDKSTEIITNRWNHLQLAKTGANSTTDFNVAYKYNTDKYAFSPDFPSTNNHVSQYWNFTVNHLQILSDDLTLKVGAQADQRQIESNDRGNHEDLHAGLYAIGVLRKNQLNASLSLRGDYDENYEFEFSPQLNISYVFDNLTLRGSAGRSIRAADYTERFVSNNLENLTPNRSLGNPDLLAERAWSEELGADFSPIKNWQLKVTGFARQSTNLIDYVSTNQSEIGKVSETGSLQAGANYFFAKNVSKVTTTGLEFESRLATKIGKKASLQWNLGYTFLNTSNTDEVISVYISSHARHLVTNTFLLNVDRFNFAITGLYKQREGRIDSAINTELADSYMVWNARLGLQLTDNFGLNLQMQNLFDEQYQNILGAKMPERWILAGVSFKM